jgi:hypothetical protein
MLLLLKWGWVAGMCSDNGSFASEKSDILQRRNFLVRQVVTEPQQLLAKMPKAIGEQFQGEWAIYSCSMLSAALVNMAYLYPETKAYAINHIDTLIGMVLSPEIRHYDAMRWGDDPIESLDGELSHISYISHLAWMISGYKLLKGGEQYDELLHELCATMNRRILHSPNLNLQTYPFEPVYVPDMLVAIVALSNYAQLHNGKYEDTVKRWVTEAKREWVDSKTGLLVSFLPISLSEDSTSLRNPVVKGSYTALSTYYLTFIDETFAKEQYKQFKTSFLSDRWITGIKEYTDGYHLLGFDIDAGPILLNLSPSGTAFAMGSITYFGDTLLRKKILRTAEIAGGSIRYKNERHYTLANYLLVGEAIMLAMRTATPWDNRFIK